MTEETSGPQKATAPPIFVVTGSFRGVGEQLVGTILAQFEDADVPVKIFSCVRELKQVKRIVAEAAATQGTIIHTMVDPAIRQALVEAAQQQRVEAIDLAGPLMDLLTQQLKQEPLGKPGLYRQLHEPKFKRIEAMDYTLAHDDGMRHEEWPEADIVLAGVSRVYKTPLSLYLAVLGWKVANVPIVMGVTPRSELYELDRRRVVGLMINPEQLLRHRRHRQRHLGVSKRSAYVDPMKLYEELENAKRIYRKGGFSVVDVTYKPIETSADEIVAAVKRRLREPES